MANTGPVFAEMRPNRPEVVGQFHLFAWVAGGESVGSKSMFCLEDESGLPIEK